MHRPVLLDWMDLSWQRKKKVGRRMKVIYPYTHYTCMEICEMDRCINLTLPQ